MGIGDWGLGVGGLGVVGRGPRPGPPPTGPPTPKKKILLIFFSKINKINFII